MLGIIIKLVLSILTISGIGCVVTYLSAELVPQLKNNDIFCVIDLIFNIALSISVICLIVLGIYGILYFIWSC